MINIKSNKLSNFSYLFGLIEFVVFILIFAISFLNYYINIINESKVLYFIFFFSILFSTLARIRLSSYYFLGSFFIVSSSFVIYFLFPLTDLIFINIGNSSFLLSYYGRSSQEEIIKIFDITNIGYSFFVIIFKCATKKSISLFPEINKKVSNSLYVFINTFIVFWLVINIINLYLNGGIQAILTRGRGDSVVNYIPLKNYFDNLIGAILLLIFLFLLMNRRRVDVYKFSFLSLMIILFVFIPSGSRRIIVFLLLQILLIWYFYSNKNRNKKKRAILLSIIIILIFTSVFALIRPLIYSGNIGNITNLITDYDFRNKEAIINLIRLGFEFPYTFDPFIAVVSNVPSKIDFLYGATLFKIFFVFIPRSIWPSKPETISRTVVKYFYPDAYDLGVSFNPTIIGEGYFNFGIVGVLFVMLLIGLISKGLYYYLLHSDSEYSSVFASVWIVFLLNSFRGYLFESFFSTMISIVFIKTLLKKKSRIF